MKHLAYTVWDQVNGHIPRIQIIFCFFYFVIDQTIKESSVEIDDEIWFTRVY